MDGIPVRFREGAPRSGLVQSAEPEALTLCEREFDSLIPNHLHRSDRFTRRIATPRGVGVRDSPGARLAHARWWATGPAPLVRGAPSGPVSRPDDCSQVRLLNAPLRASHSRPKRLTSNQLGRVQLAGEVPLPRKFLLAFLAPELMFNTR